MRARESDGLWRKIRELEHTGETWRESIISSCCSTSPNLSNRMRTDRSGTKHVKIEDLGKMCVWWRMTEALCKRVVVCDAILNRLGYRCNKPDSGKHKANFPVLIHNQRKTWRGIRSLRANASLRHLLRAIFYLFSGYPAGGEFEVFSGSLFYVWKYLSDVKMLLVRIIVVCQEFQFSLLYLLFQIIVWKKRAWITSFLLSSSHIGKLNRWARPKHITCHQRVCYPNIQPRCS